MSHQEYILDILSLTICSLSDHVHTIDVNSLILRERARIGRKDVEERREDFLSFYSASCQLHPCADTQGPFGCDIILNPLQPVE